MRLRERLLFILYSRILHSLYGTEKFTLRKNLFIFKILHIVCVHDICRFHFRFKDRNDNGEKVGGNRCIRDQSY